MLEDQTLTFNLPFKTGRGLNDRLHWAVRTRHVKEQRTVTAAFLRRRSLPLPAIVTLTRYSRGTLDDDNLQGALKAVRDGVADAFRLSDNDSQLTWVYAQRSCKGGQFGVEIAVAPRPEMGQ